MLLHVQNVMCIACSVVSFCTLKENHNSLQSKAVDSKATYYILGHISFNWYFIHYLPSSEFHMELVLNFNLGLNSVLFFGITNTYSKCNILEALLQFQSPAIHYITWKHSYLMNEPVLVPGLHHACSVLP